MAREQGALRRRVLRIQRIPQHRVQLRIKLGMRNILSCQNLNLVLSLFLFCEFCIPRDSKLRNSYKYGLTKAMKVYNLSITCRASHLGFIKDLISTYETGVGLGRRRGAVRVWRTDNDQFIPICVRRLWKDVTNYRIQAA